MVATLGRSAANRTAQAANILASPKTLQLQDKDLEARIQSQSAGVLHRAGCSAAHRDVRIDCAQSDEEFERSVEGAGRNGM